MQNLDLETDLNARFDEAVAIAVEAHRGQTDEAGEPYILHPMRVAAKLKGRAARVVGMLHGVLEDCDPDLVGVNEAHIRGFFGESILGLVRLLTRKKGCDYSQYIQRLGEMPLTTLVKIADLEDNLDPARQTGSWRMPTEMARRYWWALGYLHGCKAERIGTVQNTDAVKPGESTQILD